MSRPHRLRAFDYQGLQRYFLTICTRHRTPWFVDGEAVVPVVDHFLRSAERERVEIIAYCVMPDHVHLLVGGECDGSDLRRFVVGAKQRSGYEFSRRRGAALWQEGYWEHVLRDAERTEEVVAYIVRNPIRKGLVVTPEDYPYWGSNRYDRSEILQFLGDGKPSDRRG